jgi:hypothetical protein
MQKKLAEEVALIQITALAKKKKDTEVVRNFSKLEFCNESSVSQHSAVSGT